MRNGENRSMIWFGKSCVSVVGRICMMASVVSLLLVVIEVILCVVMMDYCSIGIMNTQ